jgi:hypothetical protein
MCGIRHRILKKKELIWTISISLLYPMAISGLLPIAWCFYRSRRSSREFAGVVAYTSDDSGKCDLCTQPGSIAVFS